MPKKEYSLQLRLLQSKDYHLLVADYDRKKVNSDIPYIKTINIREIWYTRFMKDYRIEKSIVSFVQYHFAFCARQRRKLFKKESIETRFKELVRLICKENDFELVAIQTFPEYACITLVVSSQYSPNEVMVKIKGGTRVLMSEFDELANMPNLWTRAFFVSTEEKLPTEAIELFVNNQRKQ